VGLVQTIIEQAGIATVSVSLLDEITRQVAPPRVLLVDRPLGFPLDRPDDPAAQRAVIEAALALTGRPLSEPLVERFERGGPQDAEKAG
jgi:D-proline reductase (dithiol) PrdB